MFTIRANHSESFEVEADTEKVRNFFSDIGNFIDLMPSVESIYKDTKNIIHWTIRADIPLVGSFTEKFSVSETENTDERIEWTPVKGETYNFMRYSSDYMQKGENLTIVRFSQGIELRRRSATDLHLLAGFVGENLISTEMTRRIAEMLEVFVEKARLRIEE